MNKKIFKCICKKFYNLISSYHDDIIINNCSNCHPFFSKKKNFLDTSLKIKKFNKKYEKFFK